MDDQERRVWLDERAGHVTASRIGDVLTKPRSGSKVSSVRRNYQAQLICERLTHKSLEEEKGSFFDIKRGNELEPKARVEYEMAKGVVLLTSGFIKHPTLPWAGCTPDALVGSDGMAQFKAPRKANHLDWLLNGVVPGEHKPQMYFELACCPERIWNDFCSYEEDFPQHLFIERLQRNQSEIERLELEVAKFNAEIDEIMARLPADASKTSLQERLEQSLAEVRK